MFAPAFQTEPCFSHTLAREQNLGMRGISIEQPQDKRAAPASAPSAEERARARAREAAQELRLYESFKKLGLEHLWCVMSND